MKIKINFIYNRGRDKAISELIPDFINKKKKTSNSSLILLF